MTADLDWLPPHKGGLYLTHNEHKGVYETVALFTGRDRDDQWVSPEEKRKAIETDELWCLQWYPDTPVGFCVLMASSLEAIKAAFVNDGAAHD